MDRYGNSETAHWLNFVLDRFIELERQRVKEANEKRKARYLAKANAPRTRKKAA